jgi:hypothetical protein
MLTCIYPRRRTIRRPRGGLAYWVRTQFPWALWLALLAAVACSGSPLSFAAQGGVGAVASPAAAATTQPSPTAFPPSLTEEGTAQQRIVAAARAALHDSIAVTIKGQALSLEPDQERIAAYFRHRRPDPYLDKGATRGGNSARGRKVVRESLYTLPPFDPVVLPRDLTWGEDPFQNRSWAWRLHSFAFVPDVIAYHRASSDPKALAFLSHTVDDWLRKNAAGDPPTSMSWHDQATAVRLEHIMMILEYARNTSLSPEQCTALLRAIYVHAEILVSFYARHTNHGLDQALALAVAGLAFPEMDRAAQWRQIGTERLLDECLFGLTDEGVHKENSPSYHFIFMGRLAEIAGVLRAYGRPIADYETLLAKAYRYAAYVSLPDGSLPLMGDTSLGRPRDPEVVPRSEGNSPDRQALLYSLSRARQGTKPSTPDAFFPDSGYAIFRDRWGGPRDFDQTVFLMMKMANLSTFHQHDDILSFWLYGFGESWVVDSGLYKYAEADPMRIYMRSRRAHNVVVVDQQAHEDAGRRVQVTPSTYEEGRADGRVAYARASYDVAPQVRQTREVLFIKPRLFLVRDTLHSLDGTEHSYLQLFHIDRDKVVDELPDGFSVVSRSKQGARLRIVACPDSFSAVYKVDGQTEPYIQGWVSYESFTRSPSSVVGFQMTAGDHIFRTTIELVPPGTHPTQAQTGSAEAFDRVWDTALSSLNSLASPEKPNQQR